MVPPDPQPAATYSKSSKDFVTPHKISLLVLIKEFCIVRQYSLHKRTPQKVEDVCWEHTSLQNRNFAITMLKLIQNPDMELKGLINIVHPEMHTKTYQAFNDRLQKLRKNGVAAIMDYIATLDTLLVEPSPVLPLVQKSSVLGLFIRRMLLAYDKLSFSQVTKLCSKFHVYFDAAFEGVLDEGDETSFTNSPHREEQDNDSEEGQVFASQKQAEFFIAQQAALIQMNESAALSPRDLQQKLKELMKGNPELYEACYLSYLNCLRVREYSGARENLYHHFDRNTTLPPEGKASTVSEDFTRSSRYAALLLAMLHALFGHKEQSVSALNEAIMIAQEVNDNTCLQYSLAWLYRHAVDKKEALIERSMAKSSELGLWCLSSLGIQALAKEKSLTTTLPSNIFDLLTKSDVQNCQHSMTDLLGPAYTLRSALWTYYGHEKMMQLSSQMLLFLNTADPVRGGVYHIGEAACLALRNLAIGFASEGYFAESAKVLSLARELFPLYSEHSQIWQLADLLIRFDRALYHGKWVKAHQAVKGIAIFDKHEALYRKALLLYQSEYFSECDDILKQLLEECEQSSTALSPHFHTRVLLLRAELFANTPNYANAIPMLMTCLAKSRAHHLLNIESLVIAQVAQIQLQLELPNQSLGLLDGILIAVLTHSSVYDKGCVCFLYARCMVSTAMLNQQKSEEQRKKDIEAAIAISTKALEFLRKAKALRKMKIVYTWQAYLYDHLGMIDERNYASFKCRYLEDELN